VSSVYLFYVSFADLGLGLEGLVWVLALLVLVTRQRGINNKLIARSTQV